MKSKSSLRIRRPFTALHAYIVLRVPVAAGIVQRSEFCLNITLGHCGKQGTRLSSCQSGVNGIAPSDKITCTRSALLTASCAHRRVSIRSEQLCRTMASSDARI
ncbi:hypothetical protein EDD15DRAFT_966627 [Pisolithus albus]|nr:hypothetical protein EDD15DRAFT_966627 [Pisolithus albus]